MITEFKLRIYVDDENTLENVHKVLYLLVSRGSVYNSGRYPGTYRISPKDDEYEGSSYREPESSDAGVERLPEIVAEYGAYDPASTRLVIDLYDDTEDALDYSVSVLPFSTDGKMISLYSNTGDIGSPADYRRLVEHMEELCMRLDVGYAGYVSEHDHIGSDPREDGITPNSLRRVTYYGTDLVDDFGRERLLATPADEVHEHDDGGVFLIVEPDHFGVHDVLDRAREHIAG